MSLETWAGTVWSRALKAMPWSGARFKDKGSDDVARPVFYKASSEVGGRVRWLLQWSCGAAWA